jgi:hypothetical protein
MLRTSARIVPAFLTLLALVLVALGGNAAAQDVVISPRSIVVNPVPGFELDVWVDKGRSGDAIPVYDIGENVRISVRPSEDAYIYLFSFSADGELVQVLPNRFDGGSDPFVRAGNTRTFPPEGARYSFNVAPPRGLAKVIGVASKEPLDVSTLASFRTEADFATSSAGEDAFARALRIIVQPLPNENWVSDTALYYVGQRPAQAPFGTLLVDSEPRRAEVFVDGSFVGFTPVNYGLRPGMHDVEIVSSDGRYQERVQIRPDRTTEVFATLRPRVRTGSARFVSEPSGAEVYIDGRFEGTTPIAARTFDVGRYEAEFRRDGFETRRVPFEVQADRETRVSAELRRLTGTLEVTANVGGARVFLDGREVGRIADGTGRLTVRDLAPGSHQITLVAPGYRTVVQDVSISAGRSTGVTLRQTRF